MKQIIEQQKQWDTHAPKAKAIKPSGAAETPPLTQRESVLLQVQELTDSQSQRARTGSARHPHIVVSQHGSLDSAIEDELAVPEGISDSDSVRSSHLQPTVAFADSTSPSGSRRSSFQPKLRRKSEAQGGILSQAKPPPNYGKSKRPSAPTVLTGAKTNLVMKAFGKKSDKRADHRKKHSYAGL